MGRPRKTARQRFKAPAGSKWPPTFKLGWFTAGKICLEEVAINDVVLRVPLKVHTGREPKRKRGRRPLLGKRTEKSATKSIVKRDTQRPRERAIKVLRKRRRRPLLKKRLVQSVGRRRRPKQVQEFPVNGKKDLIVSEVGILDWKQQPVGLRRLVTNLKSSERRNSESVFRNGERRTYLPAVKKLGSAKLKNVEFSFSELAHSLDQIKFPSFDWKVSMISNRDVQTELRFYNTVKPKSVSFSQQNLDFKIAIDKVPVALLGCPETVESQRDIEILLEIVNRLGLHDCMVAKM
nr:PREDICTED: uncharacterized protein LOC103312647 [Tribolium castaneum]|eukprot:XP_008192005.1 PREDICTED: uncharacterized protein LOC103312647 [Tribolium castaneum]